MIDEFRLRNARGIGYRACLLDIMAWWQANADRLDAPTLTELSREILRLTYAVDDGQTQNRANAESGQSEGRRMWTGPTTASLNSAGASAPAPFEPS